MSEENGVSNLRTTAARFLLPILVHIVAATADLSFDKTRALRLASQACM